MLFLQKKYFTDRRDRSDMMKKLFQKGKRFLALTLAAALSLSGLPAVGGMEAKASTELKAETGPINSGGTISAYEWRNSSFDVVGIKDHMVLAAIHLR